MRRIVNLLLFFATLAAGWAQTEDLIARAGEAFKDGHKSEAIKIISRLIETQPTNARAWYVRGRFHAETSEGPKAIQDFNKALALDPKAAAIYQHRGVEHFKAGSFQKSLADFDKYLDLVPNQAPQHWQRGITCYYAREFEKGRKQFELHQTANPQDVENAVWHYLCVARASGVEKARAGLIPITGDGRVPMAQIHALYAGKGTAAEVLKAAGAGNPAPARLREQLFYAHLYIGLFYEASGDEELAREHILKAANDYPSTHYMGDVARVHARLLRIDSNTSGTSN